MTAIKRTPFRRPSLRESMGPSKEFADAAMGISIDAVIGNAYTQQGIGIVAAKLSGIELQREGDGHSKKLFEQPTTICMSF